MRRNGMNVTVTICMKVKSIHEGLYPWGENTLVNVTIIMKMARMMNGDESHCLWMVINDTIHWCRSTGP